MFKGRISASQYWKSISLILVTTIGAGILLGLSYFLLVKTFLNFNEPGLGAILLLLFFGICISGLPALVALPYTIGLHIRRFHDIGLSAWALLLITVLMGALNLVFPATTYHGAELVFLPFGSVLWVLLSISWVILISWKGTKGGNKYGEETRYSSLFKAIRGRGV